MKEPIRSFCIISLLIPAALFGAADFRHPLDALTADEYWTVYETMKAWGKLDAASRYAGSSLHNHPGRSVALEARRSIPPGSARHHQQGRRTFEVLVDVKNRRAISWKEIPGVEPG